MKKITLLLLLLVTTISFGQTTLANKLKITGNVTSTTYTKINVQEADGIVNTIDKTELTDVIAVASIVNLPVTGVLSKIYITSDTNKIYRWTGTVYQELAVTDITGKVDKNAPITGGTNTKITYDSKGLVTSGTNLIASDIPNIAESQVTNLVSDLALKAPLESPTFTGTVSGITKSMVGLGNVDNTSDINKPVSTAQQTAIDAKVGDFINDGATTIAPSMNAVYDALQLKQNATSTAITSTATLTNNGTTFSLSALTGVIVDNTTVPAGRTVVNFAGATNVTPLYFRTILYINSAGTLVQFNGVTSDLTPQQRVDNLFVGIVVYSGGTVQVVQLIPDIEYSIDNRFSTLGSKIRNINEGNNISANGLNLQINKGAGTTWRLGSNFATNREVPDETTDLAQTPIPAGVNLIGYRNGVGGWTYEAFTGSITPTFWDNGSGTKQTVSNNKFTNVRDYFFNGTNTHVFYLGRTEFSTLSAAVSAAEKPDDIVDPATSVGSLIGTISVEKGCTALNNTALAAFTQGPRMQGGASSGGSSGTQSLQSTYLNSSSPHITTTPTLGAVTIKRGSTADTDNVFVVQDGAGTETGSWKGNGALTALTYNGFNPTTDLRAINTTSPLLGGGNLTADRTLSIQLATTSQNGYLSSTDWNTFNGKAPLASPSFTGTPTAPTATVGTTGNQIATLDFVAGANFWTNTSGTIRNNNTNEVELKPLNKVSILNSAATETAKITASGSFISTLSGTTGFFGSDEASGMYQNAGNHLVFRSSQDGFQFEPRVYSGANAAGDIIKFKNGFEFSPTSGTGVFNVLNLAGTINQTGGANGISRGIYINPTLTAAADFRAIDVTAGTILAPSFTKVGGTSSQFLKADGSVDTTVYQTALTNPVTGTGTSGNIVKWTGVNSLGNSLLYDNGTNVGIGTTSPSQILHLSKTSGDINLALQTGSSYGYFFNDGTNIGLGSDVGTTGKKFSLDRSAPDNSLNVKSTGNVLIGTTTDDGVNKLQVNGGIAATTYAGGASLTGTPTAPTATAGTNTTQIATTAFVQTATRPYKSYTALLTQSGTLAPTVTVLENGLSGSIVWARISEGLYHGTLTGAFTSDKTAVFTMKQTAGGATDVIRGAQRASSDVVSVMTNTDGVLTGASIEIRVYP